MKIKRIITLTLVLVLILGIIAGCEKKDHVTDGQTEETIEETPQEEQEETPSEETTAEAEEETYPEMEEGLIASDIDAFGQFTAKTVDDKTFTQEDFKKADITMIDFWQTGCAPCIAQFPFLEELRKELPENVQIITACLDGERNKELAQKILTETGFSGATIVSGDGDYEKGIQKLIYTPTYLLVDSEGKVLGEAMVNSPTPTIDDYKAIFNQALEKMGKPRIE